MLSLCGNYLVAFGCTQNQTFWGPNSYLWKRPFGRASPEWGVSEAKGQTHQAEQTEGAILRPDTREVCLLQNLQQVDLRRPHAMRVPLRNQMRDASLAAKKRFRDKMPPFPPDLEDPLAIVFFGCILFGTLPIGKWQSSWPLLSPRFGEGTHVGSSFIRLQTNQHLLA